MHITTKLGKMRKAVEWIVYPASKDGRIKIQSDHRIATFHNDGSNKALLSKYVSSGAYNLHLSPLCGATVVDIPQDVVDAALAVQPQSGDRIGPGVFVG